MVEPEIKLFFELIKEENKEVIIYDLYNKIFNILDGKCMDRRKFYKTLEDKYKFILSRSYGLKNGEIKRNSKKSLLLDSNKPKGEMNKNKVIKFFFDLDNTKNIINNHFDLNGRL